MATVWPFYKQRFGATKQFGTSAVFRLKMCSCDFDVGHVVYSGHVNLVYLQCRCYGGHVNLVYLAEQMDHLSSYASRLQGGCGGLTSS